MDTAVFLVKRREIQQRMEDRRLQVEADPPAGGRLFPWLVSAGADLVSGLRSSERSGGLVKSLLWAVLAPTVLGFMRGGSGTVVMKLLHNLLPRRFRDL